MAPDCGECGCQAGESATWRSWVYAGEPGGRKQVSGVAGERQGWRQWEQKESRMGAHPSVVLSDGAGRVAEGLGQVQDSSAMDHVWETDR